MKKKFFTAIAVILSMTSCLGTNKLNENEYITITANPDQKYQFVRGFGCMDVGWQNFPETTARDIEKMFNPDTGLGLNILRVMIMPHNTDIGLMMEDFVWRNPDFYENVKIVNKYGGYVLATPWSPPKEWKSNNHTKGDGSLLPQYRQDYADYLRSFAANMYNNGSPIYAVSIQNEPDYKVEYDGCLWSPQQMRDFFKQVGRFTEGVPGFGGGRELPSVLTMNGETFQNPKINDAALDDPVSRDVIDIIGRHPYGAGLSRYAKALDHPEAPKEVWMTEYNINSQKENLYPNDSTWNYVWKLLNSIDLSIRLNDESAHIWWAGKRFYSFIGDGQYGTEEGEIMPRGYAISHYAKFAKETWRIAVDIEDNSPRVEVLKKRKFNNVTYSEDNTIARVTAFVSEDGDIISFVMFNPSTVNGTGGIDGKEMENIKIRLPEDFVIKEASAMRSSEGKYAVWEKVKLLDTHTASVSLPPGNILSVKFIR